MPCAVLPPQQHVSVKLHVKEDKVQRVPVRWKPPDNDDLKLNTDGAFDGNHGTGAVLRDCQSVLVGRRCVRRSC
jgi:hypothetical protein